MGDVMNELGERLMDLEARIEGIFPLALGDIDGLPGWFEEFCEECDSAAKSVFERHPKMARYIDMDEYPEPASVAETICLYSSISGWVCRIAWCPRKYFDANSWQSGWGITSWLWVWGETADKALENALSEVERRHEQSRREFASAVSK